MTKYKADDGNCEIEVEAESAQDAAQAYVDGGDWSRESTTWIDVYVWLPGDEDEDRQCITIQLDPEEPACADGQEHDWSSPYEVLGGCEENPGVWGHGGGVKITEVCAHCGAYRETDTWAQRPDTGQQGLESVSYREADERSLAWLRKNDEDEDAA